jgi:salicylate 5-hydroxylase small subunit
MTDCRITREAVEALYADYAACLDAGRFADWPAFFTEDCLYELQARENFDRGLPLATLRFESQGMLRDRVFAVQETLFHQPYYQRHLISQVRITPVDETTVKAEANYAVFRTKRGGVSEVFNVGRYLDVINYLPGADLKYSSKRCIFDSELILNSIIYPI